MSRDGARDSPRERRKGGGKSTPSTPKIQPPDKKKFEKEVGDITREIKEKEARLKPVSWSPGQDLTAELAKVTAEITEAEEKKSKSTSELRKIEDSLRKLGQDVIHMKDDASKLVAGLRHKTEDKIDETVRKLEQQLQSRQFSPTDERRLQADIDSLTASKERLREYLALKEEIDRGRNEQDSLRKRRDSIYRANRDLREHEGELKDHQLELKRKFEEKREQHKEATAQKDALRKEIDALYQRRKMLQDQFKREQSSYLEATKEERAAEKAAREQESAKRREDRQLRKKKSQALEAEARDPQFEETKIVCKALLSHLRMQQNSHAPSSAGSSLEPLGATAGNPEPDSASTRGSGVPEQPGEFLRRKTEQEVLIPAALTRRKSRKDKRRHAPANKRLYFNAALFQQFAFLGITPPATHSDISSAITQLQEMLVLYESKSLSRNTGSEAGDSGVGSTCNGGEPCDVTDPEDATLDITRLSPKRGSVEKLPPSMPPRLEKISTPQPNPSPPADEATPPSNHPGSAIPVRQT